VADDNVYKQAFA